MTPLAATAVAVASVVTVTVGASPEVAEVVVVAPHAVSNHKVITLTTKKPILLRIVGITSHYSKNCCHESRR